MPKPIPTPYSTTLAPTLAESQDVHEVYEAIAPHFSSTRYKPWPLVSAFLKSLPPNSLGLDSGAGNGKYVPLAMELGRVCLALDMSWGLLSVARGALAGSEGDDKGSKQGEVTGEGKPDDGSKRGPVECLRGELGYEGWREGVFDWAISIAAIHHLSTPARRSQAVQALMRCLVHRRPDDAEPLSRFMIYVWAYEQGEGSKRRMGKRAKGEEAAECSKVENATGAGEPGGTGRIEEGVETMGLNGLAPGPSRPAGPSASGVRETSTTNHDDGADAGEIVQDVLVPWVLQTSRPSKRPPGQKRPRRKKRTVEGEKADQEQDVALEGGEGDDMKQETKPAEDPVEEPKVYHRYYHLFLRGELRELVVSAAKEDGYDVLPDPVEVGGLSSVNAEDWPAADGESQKGGLGRKSLRVLKEGWEADNWWIECEVGRT